MRALSNVAMGFWQKYQGKTFFIFKILIIIIRSFWNYRSIHDLALGVQYFNMDPFISVFYFPPFPSTNVSFLLCLPPIHHFASMKDTFFFHFDFKLWYSIAEIVVFMHHILTCFRISFSSWWVLPSTNVIAFSMSYSQDPSRGIFPTEYYFHGQTYILNFTMLFFFCLVLKICLSISNAWVSG